MQILLLAGKRSPVRIRYSPLKASILEAFLFIKQLIIGLNRLGCKRIERPESFREGHRFRSGILHDKASILVAFVYLIIFKYELHNLYHL